MFELPSLYKSVPCFDVTREAVQLHDILIQVYTTVKVKAALP